MKVANIAELKNNLSKILSYVETGESVQICKRNIPIAHIVPIDKKIQRNKTRLGCGTGTVQVKSDLTEPMIPEENWEMLRK
jgi:prevent-host-death family protein